MYFIFLFNGKKRLIRYCAPHILCDDLSAVSFYNLMFTYSFFFRFSYKESERLTCLSQTAGNRLVTAIADMGNVQQERNAISKFLDDSDIKNLLQEARQSMEILEQHARWLNEDRFVMYVWFITIYYIL